MLRACYLLENSINKIARMGKSLSANSDLDVLKNRLNFEYRNALVHFNELVSSTNDSRVESALDDFIGTIDTALQDEDYASIKMFLETLPDTVLGDYIKDLSVYDLLYYPRYFQNDASTSVHLEDEDLMTISSCFKTQTNRPINFLDARSQNGYNSNEIKKYSLENINFYAMEKKPSLANEAKDRNIFTKIAKGGLTGAKCSNDVFDVALLVPTLEYEADFTPLNTLKPRKEVEEFKQVTKYLREDGLILLVLPYYRLTSQMCTLIAKNYKDVSVGYVEKWNELVMIAGVKSLDTDNTEQDTYNLLRRISLASDIRQRENLKINNYTLPIDCLKVEMFRGNILDEEDINEIVMESKLYESFFDKQNNIIDDAKNQQPLLPFNIGQIGLVLTSGCLDGEIEELNGQYHVIKGMVKKDAITEEVPTDKKGEKETRTTYTNKVQINVITPDGTIKTLA